MCSNPVPIAADPKPAAPKKLSRQQAGFVFRSNVLSYHKTTYTPYSATRNAGEAFPSPTSHRLPSPGAASAPGEGVGGEAVQLYTILIESSCQNAHRLLKIQDRHPHRSRTPAGSNRPATLSYWRFIMANRHGGFPSPL